MKMNKLGRTNVEITNLTLGTMTYGVQTSEDDAFIQMDMALERGINAFDTAELYPVLPISRETQGESERIIGRWLKSRNATDKIHLLTKVVGPRTHLHNGEPISRKTITDAIERSLSNLQTERVALYQLHWPNRPHYHFRRQWNFNPDPSDTEVEIGGMLEILDTLTELQRSGKIGAFGVSNDTAWGVMKYLALAEKHNLIRLSTSQQEYSVLHRIFEPDLQEIHLREDIGLLSYSSLAGGLLTGKYKGGTVIPAGSRRTIEPEIGGRVNGALWGVIDGYLAIAQKHGLDPVHLAYRFVASQPFTATVIIGATNKAQLATTLADDYEPLPSEVMADINALRRIYPIPM